MSEYGYLLSVSKLISSFLLQTTTGHSKTLICVDLRVWKKMGGRGQEDERATLRNVFKISNHV